MMTTDQAEREALQAAVEADQREQAKSSAAAQRAADTEARRVAAEAVVQASEQAESDAREAAWQAKRRSPEFQAGVLHELDEAKAAFERTVVDDFPAAGTAYLRWVDAITRADRLGIQESHDYPRFGVNVDRVLYAEAGRRRGDVEAAIRAERHGGDDR